jgi:hypothetical protein
VSQYLSPGQAVHADCSNIASLLVPVVSREVCPGNEMAFMVLMDALQLPASSVTSTSPDFPYGAIKGLIEAIEQVRVLQQTGDYRLALTVENGIIDRLSGLIARAKEMGEEELEATLSKAYGLIGPCLAALSDDVEAGSEVSNEYDASKFIEGFVSIETPLELEVTTIYRSRAQCNEADCPGLQQEVVQVQPHRLVTVWSAVPDISAGAADKLNVLTPVSNESSFSSYRSNANAINSSASLNSIIKLMPFNSRIGTIIKNIR